MNPANNAENSNLKTPSAAIPDPWFLAAQAAKPFIPPAWQFPLDPNHELTSKSSPEVLCGADLPGAVLLKEGLFSATNAINFLVSEELKLSVVDEDHLRDEVGNAIAYLELAEAKVS
jgi:hypothetical protein